MDDLEAQNLKFMVNSIKADNDFLQKKFNNEKLS